MPHTRLWAAAIITVVLIVSFALSVPHTRDVGVERSLAVSTTPAVTVRDTFRKGVHTIIGAVRAPNACTSVTASAALEGSASSTARILLALSVPEDQGICLQVPTDIPFQVSVTAPAEVPITTTVNGTVASTTPS